MQNNKNKHQKLTSSSSQWNFFYAWREKGEKMSIETDSQQHMAERAGREESWSLFASQ